jgi:glycogen debranching enzyme
MSMGPDAPDDTPDTVLQPFLHHLLTCVDAPSTVQSDPDGQIRRSGVQGWFHGDRRMLDLLTATVGGEEPAGLCGSPDGASTARFTGALRRLGDRGTDPTVLLDRVRAVTHDGLEETFSVASSAQAGVDVVLELRVGTDLAPMDEVRSGRGSAPVPPTATGTGLTWHHPEVRLAADATPAPDEIDPLAGTLRWHRRLGTGERLHVRLELSVSDSTDSDFVGARTRPWRASAVECADPRVAAVVRQGAEDLHALLLRDARAPGGDAFLSAGSPWYLTLFGRDALWAARMVLPLGTGLALSTLRTLARRQGQREDPDSEEQPGKILHEVRPRQHVLGDLSFPAVYYGTVDATPLFVVLLAEAWRWGADPAEVEELLPAAEACLRWVESQAAGGFIRYVDRTGHALANQGWKDSPDSIQWADGRLAEAPIALSEVQAYAYQAAVLGADLLEHFDRPGARHWRGWADALAARFRSAFWAEDDRGRYPAVALDRHDRAVDSVASNMGHLLGTGLLDDAEAALVASRLAAADMDSGFGLRTLTRASPRYSRLSYHGGTVWPHDTAIAVQGLSRQGHTGAAASLLRGLLAAAPAFGFRLPELYSGEAADEAKAPMPYPAACRPQAWAAAAPLFCLVTLLGVDVDVPGGVVRVPRRADTGLGPLAVRGLDAGGHRLDVEVGADGHVTAVTTHPRLEVVHEDRPGPVWDVPGHP